MIKVYNVGQGDSFLFKPCCCKFETNPILIDCGLSKANVYKKIQEPIEKVLITHSHDDHINGLENVLKYKFIKDLYIPYYLTEIQNIEKFLNKKITKHSKPLPLSAIKNLNLHLLKDGDKLCKHTEILNPPREPDIYFKDWLEQSNNINIGRSLQRLNELGFELPIDDIENYISPLVRQDLLINSDFFDFNEYRNNSREFVHNFFNSLYIRIMTVETSSIHFHTISHVSLTSNQASIVLKYQNNHFTKYEHYDIPPTIVYSDKERDNSCLFTGDADISVFERIIEERGPSILKSNILKVPHHGSHENINERILRIINPKTAIVSHGNRYDHPSHDVMHLFNKLNINGYYTNDVIKEKSCLATKTIGFCANKKVEFI